MIVETEAVILQSRKFGDSSKILTAYTLEHGKLNLLAKGCRSPKSKFAAMLEPLSYLNLTFYKKSTTDLHLLSKSEIHSAFRKINESFEHLTCGFLILESLLQSQHDSERNDELFNLLTKSLFLLNEIKNNPFSLFFIFQLELAKVLGFEISFNTLEGKNSHTYCYSFENGSIFATNHYSDKNVFYFEKSLIDKMKQLMNTGLEEHDIVSLNETEIKLIAKFFTGFFSFHLDKKFTFKTMNIIN